MSSSIKESSLFFLLVWDSELHMASGVSHASLSTLNHKSHWLVGVGFHPVLERIQVRGKDSRKRLGIGLLISAFAIVSVPSVHRH